MATYPEDTVSFREKLNIAGQTYDEDKKTTIYVEDFLALEDEIIAVEEHLISGDVLLNNKYKELIYYGFVMTQKGI